MKKRVLKKNFWPYLTTMVDSAKLINCALARGRCRLCRRPVERKGLTKHFQRFHREVWDALMFGGISMLARTVLDYLKPIGRVDLSTVRPPALEVVKKKGEPK